MGWTALMSASFRGHASVVEMLLREGSCDVDALNEKRESPLWLASHQGKEGPVRLLLGAGADPFKPDEDRRTPFDVSATLHAREMIEVRCVRVRI
jgi:ankyrin repeat protein